jgi:hypothetical protein
VSAWQWTAEAVAALAVPTLLKPSDAAALAPADGELGAGLGEAEARGGGMLESRADIFGVHHPGRAAAGRRHAAAARQAATHAGTSHAPSWPFCGMAWSV